MPVKLFRYFDFCIILLRVYPCHHSRSGAPEPQRQRTARVELERCHVPAQPAERVSGRTGQQCEAFFFPSGSGAYPRRGPWDGAGRESCLRSLGIVELIWIKMAPLCPWQNARVHFSREDQSAPGEGGR
jgi:hypothetical protein